MYVLNFLAQQELKIQPFVLSLAVQLVARCTKMGWFDDQGQHQQIFTHMKSFLQVLDMHRVTLS